MISHVFSGIKFYRFVGVWGCYFIAAITEELILLAFFMRAIITIIFNLIITIYVALFNEFSSEIIAFFCFQEKKLCNCPIDQLINLNYMKFQNSI